MELSLADVSRATTAKSSLISAGQPAKAAAAPAPNAIMRKRLDAGGGKPRRNNRGLGFRSARNRKRTVQRNAALSSLPPHLVRAECRALGRPLLINGLCASKRPKFAPPLRRKAARPRRRRNHTHDLRRD